MEKSTLMHYQLVKHILHCVKETTSYELKNQRGRETKEQVSFIDSDLVRDIDDRKVLHE